MTISTPKDFSFPGKPYPVQERLMSALHSAMESCQIGLFESPTGTGKTLSIICATLTWLSENRHGADKRTATSTDTPEDTDEPDWVVAHSRTLEQRKIKDEFFRRRDAYHRRIDNSKRMPGRKTKRGRSNDTGDLFSESGDDDEPDKTTNGKIHSNVRIIFATRTHSQLQQFLEEIKRTRFAPPEVLPKDSQFKIRIAKHEDDLPLSVILFGSRKQFCINEEVRALSSSAAISERCRELTEASETAGTRKRSRNRCQYKNSEAEEIIRDRALVQMHSIEELAEEGNRLGACPYFATRAALETGDIDVIGVPYSAVLHRPTRESLGLTVDENTVVVFDEAHNIVNTICDLHSALLTRPALVQTIGALKAYVERYETRFTPTNLYKLRQLLTLAKGLLSLLPGPESAQGKARVVRPNAILFDADVDNINMYALVAYIKESKLFKKLSGFVDSELYLKCSDDKKKAIQSKNNKTRNTGDKQMAVAQRAAKQGVLAFDSFLRCISDCSPDGRVAIYPYQTNPNIGKGVDELPLEATARMKYFVVTPGNLFAASIARARAVLLLGGTLSPRAAIKQRLLSGLQREVVEFECDHVVPAENVMTRVCGIGPTERALEFTYRTRKDGKVCDELALAVEKCINLVNGGVVMFLASYEHLRETLVRWRSTGALGKIGSAKPVFLEERGSNDAFEEYQSAVREDKDRGALLIGVMGGKLSEGINFSDEFGRMVIMVGMPFPNAGQVEIGEVLKGVGGVAEQSELLENQCLTVVNQCIGRAVRHANDFASIVLMDRRYGRQRVIEKLPNFVRRDIRVVNSFGGLGNDITRFFQKKR